MPNNQKTHKMRPYARLLTMLGDQLIKNETVALTELIKNSYDADADFCNVHFDNFSKNFENNGSSKIRIADNGYGMSYHKITTDFLSPATPVKTKEPNKSKKGRICQGEKGIGRFSMLKLGKKITVFSKEAEIDVIHKIVFDFSEYDNDFLELMDEKKDIYLDNIDISYESIAPAFSEEIPIISEYGYGTEIIIEHLKGKWDSSKVLQFKQDIVKFSPIEIDGEKITTNKDFSICLFNNGQEQPIYENKIEELKEIINEKALYKIIGKYNEEKKEISFSYIEANKQVQKNYIYFNSQNKNYFTEKLEGLSDYKKTIKEYFENENTTECGDFSFNFYIFDFNANKDANFALTKDEKKLVRDHRVFLYRDGIRVQPYGATDDDWLQIDRYRANTRAGDSFSNDQIIGQIKITRRGNANLKDKTSREGLIEAGNGYKHLIDLVRIFLLLMQTSLYQNYVSKQIQKDKIEEEKKEAVTNTELGKLKKLTENSPKALESVQSLENAIKSQKKIYEQRLNMSESLAGVGLSVEVASHDIMMTMNRLKESLAEIRSDFENTLYIEANLDLVKEKVVSSEEMFTFIYTKMKDLQQLFRSSKQRAKDIQVKDIIQKVCEIYSKQYKKYNITVEFVDIGKRAVIAKTIDAVLYQVFINLFDNSLYWLQQNDSQRKVVITCNGDEQCVIFSDNGIGVDDADAPYIFESFYSGKGEEGRGLGLYIAKRLLNKYKYNIDLIQTKSAKILEGANFCISFTTEEEES